ncbi:DUF6249 domain-containing protein [Oleiagrimonas soli]|uniref:Membrane protein n=1 Tax=Oleiagrimonas soli TaxID=1543381 RepID=A0A099CT37_9GAMM|nr:DUF6249 domain-containing protein [Oleiagrimonas soli]KGI76934.1 membrane protein [Oleiagrimonas soli]MBB6185197.1 hypothetical protein [Oleiagrimonas soli]
MTFLIPITFFLCLTYAIKAGFDAIVRYRIVKEGVSGELMESMIATDREQRRYSSLRWGLFLVAIGVAFALIAAFGWTSITPGAIAVIAVCTGISQLVYYGIVRRTA